MTAAGTLYFDLVPTIRGLNRELTSNLVSPAKQSGAAAGKEIAAGVTAEAKKAGTSAGKVIEGELVASTKTTGTAVARNINTSVVAGSRSAGKKAGKEIGTAIETETVATSRGIGSKIGGGFATAGRNAGQKFGEKVKETAGEYVKQIGGTLAGLYAAEKGIEFVKGSIEAARDAQKVNAITASVIKSTGSAAHVSATQVHELAEELSKQTGVEGDSIQSTENLLLTFKGIKNVGADKIFDDTTKAALDMATAMKIDGRSAALQLGKALNDPATGMAKLQRVGVTFTAQQQAQAKAMVKAGDVAGAQGIILREVQSEFGGAAAAAATPAEKLAASWHGVEEQIGGKIVPLLTRFDTFAVNTLIPDLIKVGTWINKNRAWLVPLAEVIGAGVVAWKAYAIAVKLAELAMDSSGIGLIITGLAALGVGLVLAYKKSATFRAIVQGAFNAVKVAAMALVTASLAVVHFFTGPFTAAFVGGFETVKRTALGVVGFFTGPFASAFVGGYQTVVASALSVVHFFTGPFASVFTRTIPNAFQSAINWVKAHWKAIVEIILAPIFPLGSILLKYWAPITAAFSAAFHAIARVGAAVWGPIAVAAQATFKVLRIIGTLIYGVVALPLVLAFDAIRIATRATWGWIGPYVMGAWRGVSNWLRATWTSFQTWVGAKWALIKIALVTPWNESVAAIKSAWRGASNWLRTTWTTFQTWVGDKWALIKIALVTPWNDSVDALKSAWRGVSNWLHTTWTSFQTWVSAKWALIKNALIGPWNATVDGLKAGWRGASNWFASTWRTFQAWVGAKWNLITGALSGPYNSTVGALKSTWRSLSNWFHTTWNSFQNWVSAKWGLITGKITGAFSAIPKKIGDAWNKVKGAFSGPINWIGQHVINTFIGAIQKVPGVKSVIKKLPQPLIANRYNGGPLAAGQWSWVGERGPELMRPLPGGGAQVLSNRQSLAATGGRGPNRTQGIPGYLFGGIIHGIKDIGSYTWKGAKEVGHGARVVTGTVVGGIVRAAEKAANAAINNVPGGTFFHDLADGVMGKVGDSIENWIKGKGTKSAAGNAKFTGSGNVKGWITQALDIMGMSHKFINGISQLISNESGGNPNAINLWDSNAKAGHPSMGLMQTIMSTFMRWVWPALRSRSIFDPVANVTAGTRYALAEYGPAMLLAGGRHVNGKYVGYDTGGVITPGYHQIFNGTGGDELVFNQPQIRALAGALAGTPSPHVAPVNIESFNVHDGTDVALVMNRLAHTLTRVAS